MSECSNWHILLLHHVTSFFSQLITEADSAKYVMVADGKSRRLEVKNVTSKDEGLFKCVVQGKETSGKLYVAREYPDVTLRYVTRRYVTSYSYITPF